MTRLAFSALAYVVIAAAQALVSNVASAAETEVERECSNGVCGQSEYVDGKVQITVSSQLSRTTHFNFKTNPGAQIEIRGSYSFDRAPGDSGTYSVQACDKGGFGSRSTCTKWATFNWTSGPDPAAEAAWKEENDRIASDRQVTGKGPTDCEKSRNRCFVRCQGRGGLQSTLCQSNECMPIFNACIGNAQVAEAAFADERRVTGKSPQECDASRASCTNRCQRRGPFQGNISVAQECMPIFNACVSNATRNRGENTAALIEVVQPVDVYAEKFGSGGKTDELARGNKVTLLEPCGDDWCHVKYRTGSGWVYNGADYRSLDIP